MSEQETEVTEDQAFETEMKRLNGVDVEEAPAALDDANDSDDAAPEVTEDTAAAETEDADDPKEEDNDLVKQLDNLRQQNEKLQKALDKTNGTYGSQLANLQQQIQSLTQQRQEKTDEVKKQISPAKLEKVREQFPELADLLEVDLSTAIASPGMPDYDGIKSEFQKQLDAERQARAEEMRSREIRLLKREHPDYESVAGFTLNGYNGVLQWSDAGFGNWVASQSEDVQNEIINGSDAYVLSDYITEYKKMLNQQPQKKPVNLKKAIQPKGVPAGRNTVLDEEEQAFRDEMKRLSGHV